MGDPISPAMTIGTCAWMEEGWMATLTLLRLGWVMHFVGAIGVQLTNMDIGPETVKKNFVCSSLVRWVTYSLMGSRAAPRTSRAGSPHAS